MTAFSSSRQAHWRLALTFLTAAIPCAANAQDQVTELETIDVEADSGGSLVGPDLQQAREAIQRTPGAVEVVPGATYRNATPATTVKDVLDYVPGAFTQTRWGTDTRLSIRGSALSRNYGLRGVQMLMDGIPLMTADGFGDFGVVDPGAYSYTEVFKGANALRYGANSLGGAINLVSLRHEPEELRARQFPAISHTACHQRPV